MFHSVFGCQQVILSIFTLVIVSKEQLKLASHHWFFNTSTHFEDARTGYNGLVFGNDSDVTIQGARENYLHIDGSSAVGLGPLQSNCLSQPQQCKQGFTLALWLRITNRGILPRYLLRTIHSYKQGFGVLHTASDLKESFITLYVKSSSLVWTSSIEVKHGVWTHIAVIWKPNAVLNTYCNGRRKLSLKNRTTIEEDEVSEWKLLFTHPPGNMSESNDLQLFLYLEGEADYDDVMIWYDALTETKLRSVFQKQFDALQSPKCFSSDTTLNVTWQPGKDTRNVLVNYQLRLKKGVKFKTITSVVVPKTRTSQVFRDLSPYTSYRIKFWARTVGNASTKIGAIKCRTEEGVPDPVEQLKVWHITSSSIYLRWFPPAHINGVLQGYKVVCKSDGSKQLNESIVRGNTEFVIRGLREASEYVVSVSAFTGRGSGIPVNITMTTNAIPQIKDSPRQLKITDLKWNSLRLRWKALSSESEVERYQVQICVPEECVTSEATIAGLAITNLSQGTKYTINVRGKNQRGPGPWSTEAASVETPDRNECQDDGHRCSAHAQCVNTAGSYHCICLPGLYGDGRTCRVPIRSNLEDFCPKESYRNMTWESTFKGQTVTRVCPPGTVGNKPIVIQLCNAPSSCAVQFFRVWQHSKAVRRYIKAKLFSSTIGGDTAVEITSELVGATDLTSHGNVMAGDLKQAVDIMAIISKKGFLSGNSSMSGEKASSLTQNVVQVANNLLDGSAMDSWQDMPKETRSKDATKLIQSVERIALGTAALRNSSGMFFMETTKVVLSTNSFGTSGVTARVSYPPEGKLGTNLSSEIGRVSFPVSAVRSKEKGVPAQAAYIYYKNIGELLIQSSGDNGTSPDEGEAISAGGVVSFTLQPIETSHLKEPVVITFRNSEVVDLSAPLCVFWNVTRRFWSNEGCHLNTSNVTHTVCYCNHLTSFSVLMQHAETSFSVSKEDKLALSLISYIGIGVSIAALVLALITFCSFSFLRTSHTFAHANLAVSLLLAETVFVAGVDKTSNKYVCMGTAIFLHYVFLVVFSWMVVEGVILYMVLVKVFPTTREGLKRRCFFVCSWGTPAVLVCIAAVFRPGSYGNNRYCWLSVEDGFIWAFVGPILFICAVNLVFLFCVFRVMHKRSATKNREKSFHIRYWAKACAVLTCILGTTWLLGLFFVNRESVIMAYLFNIFNALQGLFIFVFHCLLDEKIRAEYKRILCCGGSRREVLRRKSAATAGMLLNSAGHSGSSSGTALTSLLSALKTRLPNSTDKTSPINQKKNQLQNFTDNQELKAGPVQCDGTYRDVSANSQSESLRTINLSEATTNHLELLVPRFGDTSEAEEETEVDDHVIPEIYTHQPPRTSYGGSSCACSACSLDYTDTYADSQTYPYISDISQATFGMSREYRLSCTSSIYDNVENEDDDNNSNSENTALADEKQVSDLRPAPWKFVGGLAKFEKCNSCCDGTYSVMYYRDSQISISSERSRCSREYLENEENASMLQSEIIRENNESQEDSFLLKKEVHDDINQSNRVSEMFVEKIMDSKPFSEDLTTAELNKDGLFFSKIWTDEPITLKTKHDPDEMELAASIDDSSSQFAAKMSIEEQQRNKQNNIDIINRNCDHGLHKNKSDAYQEIEADCSLFMTATPKELVDNQKTELDSEDINDTIDELQMPLITSQVKDGFSSTKEASPELFPCREQFVSQNSNFVADCELGNIEENETIRSENYAIHEDRLSNTKLFQSCKKIVIRSPDYNTNLPVMRGGDKAPSCSRPKVSSLPDSPKQDTCRAPKQEKVRRLGEMFEQNKLSTRLRGRPSKGKHPRYFGSGFYMGPGKEGRLRDMSTKRIGKVKSLREKFEKTAVVDKDSATL